AFASASRAAGEVRILSGLAVIVGDDLFGEDRNAVHSDLREIDARLLIDVISSIKRCALVSGIRGDHCEAPSDSRAISGGTTAHRGPDTAVISAAALEQETVVPVVGQRQLEADAVRSSVRPGALINHPFDPAVRRDGR